jgi:hypothetical protein
MIKKNIGFSIVSIFLFTLITGCLGSNEDKDITEYHGVASDYLINAEDLSGSYSIEGIDQEFNDNITYGSESRAKLVAYDQELYSIEIYIYVMKGINDAKDLLSNLTSEIESNNYIVKKSHFGDESFSLTNPPVIIIVVRISNVVFSCFTDDGSISTVENIIKIQLVMIQ